MKKIYIALLAVMALSVAASAEVGIGLKGGIFQQDNNLQNLALSSSPSISNDKYFGGAEFIFQDWIATTGMLGFKIGAEFRAPLKMTDDILNDEFKNDFYSFPVTLYYKFVPECSMINFWLGGGVTVAYSRWAVDMNNYPPVNMSESDIVVFPHLKAGIELRATQHVALGLDVGYNFAAKANSSFAGLSQMQRDITGFEGNLALRFYF
ncbi:MAG: porin family protein [Elusimicrobia bacterium]|nr:porin family protein [Elusimicrobiota bacterium]